MQDYHSRYIQVIVNILLTFGHPPMCSMSFNVDHSSKFPESRQPRETEKGNLRTKSNSLPYQLPH